MAFGRVGSRLTSDSHTSSIKDSTLRFKAASRAFTEAGVGDDMGLSNINYHWLFYNNWGFCHAGTLARESFQRDGEENDDPEKLQIFRGEEKVTHRARQNSALQPRSHGEEKTIFGTN